jgi:hypothetical protein
MNEPETDWFKEAQAQFEQILQWLSSDTACGLSHSEIEALLRSNGNELLRRLLQGYLDSRSEDEIEGECRGSDEIERTHRRSQVRGLVSVFGEVQVRRIGYGGRKMTSLHPLDAELNLPVELYSHGLRRQVAQAAAKNSFSEVVQEIQQTTAAQIAKRQVEELAERASWDFDEFYQTRHAEAEQGSASSGSILVLSVDGKGVVMRLADLREGTKQRAQQRTQKVKHRLSAGEKRNAKRMATVAAVYTLEPWVRRPVDIVDATERTPETQWARPHPQHKRVWASLVKSPKQVIADAFAEALHRDPQHNKQWVALVDGNPTPIKLLKAYARGQQVHLTIILDLIHVLEYLWKAAYVFAAPGTLEAETWVSERLLRLLQGESSQVAAGMRRSATLRQLDDSQRQAVDKCADYLLKYSPYLRYDHYLQHGFPIATGVIEGACRYLVKDRMDITGARWSLQGAEAVLRLRALHASGDFDAYWNFHLECERHHNHAVLYQNGIPLLQRVLSAQCLTPPQLSFVV